MKPSPLPLPQNHDRNFLVGLGSTQDVLPTIHGIDAVAVQSFEKVAFGESDLVPEAPFDKFPNPKTQHRFTVRRKLGNEPSLLQELGPAA